MFESGHGGMEVVLEEVDGSWEVSKPPSAKSFTSVLSLRWTQWPAQRGA